MAAKERKQNRILAGEGKLLPCGMIARKLLYNSSVDTFAHMYEGLKDQISV